MKYRDAYPRDGTTDALEGPPTSQPIPRPYDVRAVPTDHHSRDGGGADGWWAPCGRPSSSSPMVDASSLWASVVPSPMVDASSLRASVVS
ncbi:MAG: hypothetical protein ACYDER_16305 [Ktedonobacteraceae bacterium]